jgi:hypothetical protein
MVENAARTAGRVAVGLGNAAIDPVVKAVEPFTQQFNRWDYKPPSDNKLSPADWFTAHQQAIIGAGGAGAAAAGRQALDFTIGPNLVNAMEGRPYSKGWAAVEAAGFIPFGKGFTAIRITRALGRAGQAVRVAGATGEEAQRIYDEAFAKSLRMPGTIRTVAAKPRRVWLRGEERDTLHQWFDKYSTSMVTADLHKQQADQVVWEAVKYLPAGERKEAAARIYNDIRDHLGDTMPERGIRPVRNARIEAERNPHMVRLPPGGVKPLTRRRRPSTSSRP